MAVLTNKTVDLTDADIDAARVKGSRHKESLAVDAGYEAGRDAVFIVMDNGIRLEVPRGLLQGLEDATPEQLAQVQVLGSGTAIAWDDPNIGFTVLELCKGIFGSRAWMSELGRMGGAMTSERKAAAARANGAQGGRPRSAETCTT